MSKYCIMPFASLRIEDQKNAQSMGIRPCCLFRPEQPMEFQTVDQYLNSDFLKQLQHHLLTQDELPLGCRTCHEVESKNHPSVRTRKQKFFNNQYLDKTDIQELDIFPSNLCNLSCVMCSSKFSSAYAAESKKLGRINEVQNFDITTSIVESLSSLNNIEYATIAGGEFFYLKHRRSLLEKLHEKNSNMRLLITTNGTIYDNDNIDILKQFPNLVLRFSIDGTGNHYDIIRYPANWSQVRDNTLQYRSSLPNASIETIMVTQPLGIFSLFDWMYFANQHKFETHWNPFYGNLFSWKILTDIERQLVSDWVLTTMPKHQITSHQKLFLLNLAKNVLPRENFSQDARLTTLSKLSDLCRIRQWDVQRVFKVLEPWPDLSKEFKASWTKT